MQGSLWRSAPQGACSAAGLLHRRSRGGPATGPFSGSIRGGGPAAGCIVLPVQLDYRYTIINQHLPH